VLGHGQVLRQKGARGIMKRKPHVICTLTIQKYSLPVSKKVYENVYELKLINFNFFSTSNFEWGWIVCISRSTNWTSILIIVLPFRHWKHVFVKSCPKMGF
jgi:hypothetical protein